MSSRGSTFILCRKVNSETADVEGKRVFGTCAECMLIPVLCLPV